MLMSRSTSPRPFSPELKNWELTRSKDELGMDCSSEFSLSKVCTVQLSKASPLISRRCFRSSGQCDAEGTYHDKSSIEPRIPKPLETAAPNETPFPEESMLQQRHLKASTVETLTYNPWIVDACVSFKTQLVENSVSVVPQPTPCSVLPNEASSCRSGKSMGICHKYGNKLAAASLLGCNRFFVQGVKRKSKRLNRRTYQYVPRCASCKIENRSSKSRSVAVFPINCVQGNRVRQRRSLFNRKVRRTINKPIPKINNIHQVREEKCGEETMAVYIPVNQALGVSIQCVSLVPPTQTYKEVARKSVTQMCVLESVIEKAYSGEALTINLTIPTSPTNDVSSPSTIESDMRAFVEFENGDTTISFGSGELDITTCSTNFNDSLDASDDTVDGLVGQHLDDAEVTCTQRPAASRPKLTCTKLVNGKPCKHQGGSKHSKQTKRNAEDESNVLLAPPKENHNSEERIQSTKNSHEGINAYGLPTWCITVQPRVEKPEVSCHLAVPDSNSDKIVVTSERNGFSYLPYSIQQDLSPSHNHPCSPEPSRHIRANCTEAQLRIPVQTLQGHPPDCEDGITVNSEQQANNDSCKFAISELPCLHTLVQQKSPTREQIAKGLSELRTISQGELNAICNTSSVRSLVHECIAHCENILNDPNSLHTVNFATNIRELLKRLLQIVSSQFNNRRNAYEVQKSRQNPLENNDPVELVKSTVDAILYAMGNSSLLYDDYKALRQNLINLITVKQSTNTKSALVELDAPDSLYRDIEDLVASMDQQFNRTQQIQIDGAMRYTFGDLIYRLNLLVSTCDSRPISLGLQTLYDVTVLADNSQVHHIILNRSQTTHILRALELANREHTKACSTNPIRYIVPENLSSVSEQLSRRLYSELTHTGQEYIMLNLKEAMVIQSVLLAVISSSDNPRDPGEKALDAKYFAYYARRIHPVGDSTDDELSADALSPIAELCTPDSSLYETDISQHEQKPVLRNGLTGSVSLVNGKLTEPPTVQVEFGLVDSSANGKKPQDTIKADVISFSPDLADGATHKGRKEIIDSFEDNPSQTAFVAIDKSIIKPIVSYVHSQLLDWMSNPTQVEHNDRKDSLQTLSCNLNATLRSSLEASVQMPTSSIACVMQFLQEENTAYTRILKRSLEDALREASFSLEVQPQSIHSNGINHNDHAQCTSSVLVQPASQLNSLIDTVEHWITSDCLPEEAQKITMNILKLESSFTSPEALLLFQTAKQMQNNPRDKTQMTMLLSQLQTLRNELQTSCSKNSIMSGTAELTQSKCAPENISICDRPVQHSVNLCDAMLSLFVLKRYLLDFNQMRTDSSLEKEKSYLVKRSLLFLKARYPEENALLDLMNCNQLLDETARRNLGAVVAQIERDINCCEEQKNLLTTILQVATSSERALCDSTKRRLLDALCAGFIQAYDVNNGLTRDTIAICVDLIKRISEVTYKRLSKADQCMLGWFSQRTWKSSSAQDYFNFKTTELKQQLQIAMEQSESGSHFVIIDAELFANLLTSVRSSENLDPLKVELLFALNEMSHFSGLRISKSQIISWQKRLNSTVEEDDLVKALKLALGRSTPDAPQPLLQLLAQLTNPAVVNRILLSRPLYVKLKEALETMAMKSDYGDKTFHDEVSKLVFQLADTKDETDYPGDATTIYVKSMQIRDLLSSIDSCEMQKGLLDIDITDCSVLTSGLQLYLTVSQLKNTGDRTFIKSIIKQLHLGILHSTGWTLTAAALDEILLLADKCIHVSLQQMNEELFQLSCELELSDLQTQRAIRSAMVKYTFYSQGKQEEFNNISKLAKVRETTHENIHLNIHTVHMLHRAASLESSSQKGDSMDYAVYLAYLVGIKNKLLEGKCTQGALLRSEKYSLAYVFRQCKSMLEPSFDKDRQKTVNELVYELIQEPDSRMYTETIDLRRITNQIDCIVEELKVHIQEELKDQDKLPCTSRQIEPKQHALLAALLWAESNCKSSNVKPTVDSSAMMSCLSRLDPKLREILPVPVEALENESRPLLNSLLMHAVKNTGILTTRGNFTRPEDPLKLTLQLIYIRQLSNCLDLPTTSSITALIDEIFDQWMNDDKLSMRLLEEVTTELSTIASLSRAIFEESIGAALFVISEQSKPQIESVSDNDFVRASTPLSVSSREDIEKSASTTGVNLTAADTTRLIEALSLTILHSKGQLPIRLNQAVELMEKLRFNNGTLERDDAVLVHQLLSHAIDSFESSTPENIQNKQTVSSIIDFTNLQRIAEGEVLNPVEAAQQFESITLILNSQSVSEPLENCLRLIAPALLRASINGQSFSITNLPNIPDTFHELLSTELKKVEEDEYSKLRQDLVERLHIFRMYAFENPIENNRTSANRLSVLNYCGNIDPTQTTQRLDPKTTGLLHRCLITQMRNYPPTINTMLQLLGILSELEESKDITLSTENIAHTSEEQLYIPMEVSISDLDIITNFLSIPNSICPNVSEQLTALFFVQRTMDGESLWPAEAILLLSALETLAATNDVATKRIINELSRIKSRLRELSFIQEYDEDISDSVGLEIMEEDCKKLRSLHRVCEISLTRKAREFVQRVLGALQTSNTGKSELSTDELSMLHIFTLYLTRQTNLTPQEIIILNRLMINIATHSIDAETVTVLHKLYEEGKVFTLYEMQTLDRESPTNNEQLNSTPQILSEFIPDMLEQLLGASISEELLPYGCTILLTSMLHTLTLMYNQVGWEKFAEKWSIHLKRLVWRLLGTALLQQPVKLDVRSRALISLACNNYRGVFRNVLTTQITKSLHMLEAYNCTQYLNANETQQLSDTISLLLSSPLRYQLTPTISSLLFRVKTYLYCGDERSVFSDYELQFLLQILGRGREGSCAQDSNASTLVKLLVNLRTVEGLLEKMNSDIPNDRVCLSNGDAAMLYAALISLNNRSYQQLHFQSWDSDDQLEISQDCRAVLGLTQSFLCSVLPNTDGVTSVERGHPDSIRLSDTELDKLRELVNFWKPRLFLESQCQRTSTIRKLSISNECDITADITNSELVSALQLTVVSAQFQQAEDAWICVNTLEELREAPELEYVSLPNQLRNTLRSAMCPIRENSNAAFSDACLLSNLTYLSNFLPTLVTQSPTGGIFDVIIRPSDAAAFGTSLLSTLPYISANTLPEFSRISLIQQQAQRSLCAAANLEQYELALSEVTEISKMVQGLQRYLNILVNQQFHELSASVSSIEGQVGSDQVLRQLNSEEKRSLLEALRAHMLLCPPEAEPQEQRGNIFDLLEYLTCPRPACVTVSQHCILRELGTSFDAPYSNLLVDLPTCVGRIQNPLQKLVSNESARFSLSVRPVRIYPREAILLSDLLRYLQLASDMPSSEIALLQAAFGYTIASGQAWSQWVVLPSETKDKILAHICAMIECLIAKMKDCKLLNEKESSNLLLVEVCLRKLIESIERGCSNSVILSSLQIINHLLPKKHSVSEKHKLQRSTHVEQYSSEQRNLVDSLVYSVAELERNLDSDKYFPNSELIASLLVKINCIKQYLANTNSDKQGQAAVQQLEEFVFRLITEPPERKMNETSHVGPRRLSLLTSLVNQLRQICNEPETIGSTHSSHEPQNPSTSVLESTNTYPCTSSQYGSAVDQAYSSFDRLIAACQPRVMEANEVADLTSSIDLLHKATHRLTSLNREGIPLSSSEKQMLQTLQQVADTGEPYEMDDATINKLQLLGQRLMTPVLEANRNLLRTGLSLWLSASVTGNFIFNSTEASQIHSALCLARNTINRNKFGGSSEDVLRMLDEVIEQFSTTVDSGIGTELTGPNSMGPVVTGFLEDAQRVHESLQLSASVLSTPPSTISDWCANFRTSGNDKQLIDSSTIFASNLTDESTFENFGVEIHSASSVWQNETSNSRLDQDPSTMHPLPKSENATSSWVRKGKEISPSVSGRFRRDLSCPLRTKTLAETIDEEQHRLKTWEKLVEARLKHACDRVEGLLAMFPGSNSEETVSEDSNEKERFDELQRLREEVLYLKEQLKGVMRQLEETERTQKRQALYASSIRELIERQKWVTKQLKSTQSAVPVSLHHSKSDECCSFLHFPVHNTSHRLYRSTECLTESSQQAPPYRARVFSSRMSKLDTFEFPNVCARPNRLSSLDRLHQLIEIRRAVVAGSREELCRLGAYSSLPLKRSCHTTPHCCPTSGTITEYATNPWILRTLIGRQRSYTDHLLGRSSYEQYQSNRVLATLEKRLADLEKQLTPPDCLSITESSKDTH